MNIEKEDYVSLSDINISSYLLSTEKVKLVGFDKTNPQKIFFHFSPKNIAGHLIEDYLVYKADFIQPKKLFSSLRDLKELIFGGNKNGN